MPSTHSHPGPLVSLLWVAHQSGDAALARSARERFGIEVRINRRSRAKTEPAKRGTDARAVARN
jgi:hypothetical protein